MKLFRSSEDKEAAAQAKAAFEETLPQLDTDDPVKAREAMGALRAQTNSVALTDKERTELTQRWALVRNAAFRRASEAVLADDILSVQEELSLMDLSEAMEIEQEALENGFRDIFLQLVVARANDGRLSEIAQPRLMTKGDEVVHLETPAALMKEVAIREYRGGYGGFSFRVAKGVRYSTGRTRGHSVVVGTEVQVADTGVLSVSSTRAAFLGAAKTIEFAYAKLMSVEVFQDGIRLAVSNRQTTPLFKVESGDVVGATLNAAMQRFEERPTGRSPGRSKTEDLES
jgi:hypothetical protein